MKQKFLIEKMDQNQTKELIDLILKRENLEDLGHEILQIPRIFKNIVIERDAKKFGRDHKTFTLGPAFYMPARAQEPPYFAINNEVLNIYNSLQFLPPFRMPKNENLSVEQLFSIIIHHEIHHHKQYRKKEIANIEEFLIKKEREFMARNRLSYAFKHSKFLLEIDAYQQGFEKTLELFQQETRYPITYNQMIGLKRKKAFFENKKNMYFDDHLFDNVDLTRFSKKVFYKDFDDTVLGLEFHPDGTKKNISEILQSAVVDEKTIPEIYYYLIGKQAKTLNQDNIQDFNEQEKQWLNDSFNWYTGYFAEKRKVNNQLLQEKGISEKEWLANEEMLNQQLSNSMQAELYLNEKKEIQEENSIKKSR